MKHPLTILFLIYSFIAMGQSSRKELADSKIYVKATYIDKKNEYISLQTRTELTDTVIEAIKYRKFETSDFTDYNQKRETNTFYESFEKDIYCLLDHNLHIVHKLDYNTNKEQTGTIFGKQSVLLIDYIDTRNSYPRGSLIPTDKTPKKYSQKDHPETYLIIIPDLQSLVVASYEQLYTKQLMGDNYNDISKGFQHHYTASTKFDIQKGDEIQLFYRRKWYNDTTNLAEYEDKQFKNVIYIGDTFVNDKKQMKFEVESYNYLSGSYESEEEFFVAVTDSGYNVGYRYVPFQTYKTELKIIENERGKDILLQGVTYDTIDGYSYPKIVQASNDVYRYYILSFFPMPFVEFGNVQGIITYSKIKGVEKGKKRERTYITNENNIRHIVNKKKNKVEMGIYFLYKAAVEIEIQDIDTKEILVKTKAKAKQGLNTFVVRSKKFEKNKQYRVLINYTAGNNSGSFSNSVKIKY